MERAIASEPTMTWMGRLSPTVSNRESPVSTQHEESRPVVDDSGARGSKQRVLHLGRGAFDAFLPIPRPAPDPMPSSGRRGCALSAAILRAHLTKSVRYASMSTAELLKADPGSTDTTQERSFSLRKGTESCHPRTVTRIRLPGEHEASGVAREGGTPPRALEVVDASHRYGDVAALRHASVDASPGEFLTLLGPSGSGKTTLLRIIAGLETPSAIHTLRIAGVDVRGVAAHQRNCATVFQHFALFPHMSVGENRRVRSGGSATERRMNGAGARARSVGAGAPFPPCTSAGSINSAAASASAWHSRARS